MNDDSRSRHPSRLGPRNKTDESSPAEDDDLLYLVEEDNKKYRRQRHLTLADLYRKAKERGLVLPHQQYR
jgi:hypothetical protein